MISILIPIYNWDVTKLIDDLHSQAMHTDKEFEFILIDDESDESYKNINRSINEYSNLQYIELIENIGRSKIRNRLAAMAKYEHLIFMDCDSQIVTNNYIENYLKHCEGEKVVCGGRVYYPAPPDDENLLLRWKYGVHRESTIARIRNNSPNRSFMTNNFMISKSIFNKITFDEKLIGYGHEDTLFGLELARNSISINHIDNQLFHVGLESADEFLSKTNQGLSNLLLLLNTKENLAIDLIENVKVLKIFTKFKKFCLVWITAFLFNLFKKYIIRNLKSNNPSLLFFDFYKLGYLCTI